MKPRPFIAASDSHGDLIDSESRRAVLAFIKDFKPQVRIHLGDWVDLRNLRNGASPDEVAESSSDDFDAGYDFLGSFFGPNTENYLLNGNHDDRLWVAANSKTDGVLRDYATDRIRDFHSRMRRMKVKVLPYDARKGVLRIGHLKCIHGYAVGESAARKHARVYGNVIFGHTHRIESAPVESIDGPMEARGIGALCTLDQGYNSRQMNKLSHENGWAYGFLFADGSYQLFQTRKLKGSFYACHGSRAY